MGVLRSIEKINEEVVFASLAGKILTLLPNGVDGAWLEKYHNYYIWNGDVHLSYDILKKFIYIKREMPNKSLFITYKDNLFVASLNYNARVGGYKEGFIEEKIEVTGTSVYNALYRLNIELKKQHDYEPIVYFEDYQRKLKIK